MPSRKTADSDKHEDLLARLRGLDDDAPGGMRDDAVDGASDILVDQWRRQRPDLDLGGFALALRIRRLAMLLDESLSAICADLGTTTNDFLLFMALRRLGRDGALRPTDIMRMHSVTSGTVTYRIDRLIGGGFVERLPDESDLRGYRIRLTPHGGTVVDRGVEAFAELCQTAFADLLALTDAEPMLAGMLRVLEFRLETAPVGETPGDGKSSRSRPAEKRHRAAGRAAAATAARNTKREGRVP